MNSLKLINLPAQGPGPQLTEGGFVLKTCQRTLFLGRGTLIQEFPKSSFEFYVGREAYQFLLEVVCGLKSHLLAENEVLGQFKEAYQAYGQNPKRDTILLKLLEKILKDAKEVRSLYLTHVGQQSYASLTRCLLSRKRASGPVAILGSGSLAFSLVKLLKKKYQLTLWARNIQRQEEICSLFSIEKLSWEEKERLSAFPAIINTIGSEETLFDEGFFQEWAGADKIFIDLAHPSPVQTSWKGLIGLESILKEGSEQSLLKEHRLSQAQEHILELSQKRNLLLKSPDKECPL